MYKQTELFPIPMVHGNKAISDTKELPAAFNYFFTSVFWCNSLNSVSLYSLTVYASLISFIYLTSYDVQLIALHNLKPNSLNAYASLTSSIYLTSNDVQLIALHILKPKHNSPDGIPAFFLKTFTAFVFSPLIKIFNYSLQSSSLPQEWRHASVSLTFKGQDSVNDISNCRPISCTSNPRSQEKSLSLWSRNVY